MPVRFQLGPEPARPPAAQDAWGSDDEVDDSRTASTSGRAAQQHGQARLANHSQARQQQLQLGAHVQPQLSSRTQLGSGTSSKASSRPLPHAAVQATANGQKQQLQSLQRICLGILGRHVTELVHQLGEQLRWLPPDVKAALLAVARRRGELTGAMLRAVADESWTQLDLSGCSKLFGADLVEVASTMPNMQVVDFTGCDRISTGGWKKLAHLWPSITILRLGGSPACTQEALKALPHILPGLHQRPQWLDTAVTQATAHTAAPTSLQGSVSAKQLSSSDRRLSPTHQSTAVSATAREASSDHNKSAIASSDGTPSTGSEGPSSWEELVHSDSESDDGCSSHLKHVYSNSEAGYAYISDTSSNWIDAAGGHADTAAAAAHATAPAGAEPADYRLKHLRVLVWPDIPSGAVHLVKHRCPKVAINPPITPHPVTGQSPPVELNPALPLDEKWMELVGPGALEDVPSQQQGAGQSATPVRHIADKFKTAYMEQAARLRDKARRDWQVQQRRQLRSSHALRTMEAWLDEGDV